MWDDVVEETPAAEEKPAEEAAPAEGAAPDQAAAAPEGAPGEAKPEAEPPKGDEAKRLLCKHWVRPTFSQYNYIYEYRKSYYDDIITYLDKRNHGIPVEKPAPQTWGERALRTYLSKGRTYSQKKANKDIGLCSIISTGAKFHRAHTKCLLSRKYSKLGFTAIFI